MELKEGGKLKIVSTPYSNGIQYIGMNVKRPPFDDLKVRQAVAYAIPYQKIMDAVLFGLAKPMYGAARQRRPRWLGRNRPSTTPILPRRRRCWPKPAILAALRPRCRSISALPASTSRCAC